MKAKKAYLLIIVMMAIVLFFVNCTSSVNVPTNITEIIKDGNYRILRTEEIDSEGNIRIETYSYNENNQILVNEVTQNGNIIKKIVNNYNSDGKLIKQAKTEYSYSRETIYEYNEKGNLIKEEWKGNEGYGFIVYDYDEKGRMIFREHTNFTEEIIDDEYYSARYFYDDEDRLIKQVSIESHGLQMTDEFIYNKQGLLIEERHSHLQSNWEAKTIYTYDKDGNMLSSKGTDSDGIIYNQYYKYQNGFLIESGFEVYNENDKSLFYVISKETYYYNNNGLLSKKEMKYTTKSSFIGDSEESIIETYKYDDNSNLIEKIVENNGKKTTTKYYYEKY